MNFQTGTDPINAVNTLSQGADPHPKQKYGLHSKDQFLAMVMKAFPGTGSSAVLSAGQVSKAIDNIRAPTCYEALNYLIPNQNTGSEGLDTVGMIPKDPSVAGTDEPVEYKLFAPLMGNPPLLYANGAAIKQVLDNYLGDNQNAIETYLVQLHEAAESIKDSAPTGTSVPLNPGTGAGSVTYEDAADFIHDGPDAKNPPAPGSGPSGCGRVSLASKFKHFFGSGGSALCGLSKPLAVLASQYWNDLAQISDFDNFYNGRYTRPSTAPPPSCPTGPCYCPLDNKALMTAYAPGPRQGAELDGHTPHPFFSERPLLSIRNYYSTKFVAIENLMGTAIGSYYKRPIYQETKSISIPIHGLSSTLGSSQNQLVDSSGALSIFEDPDSFNGLNH